MESKEIYFESFLGDMRDYLLLLEEVEEGSEPDLPLEEEMRIECEGIQKVYSISPDDEVILGLYRKVADVERQLYNCPEMMSIVPGCDCGCGGDMLDDDDWGHAAVLQVELTESENALKWELSRRGLIVKTWADEGLPPMEPGSFTR